MKPIGVVPPCRSASPISGRLFRHFIAVMSVCNNLIANARNLPCSETDRPFRQSPSVPEGFLHPRKSAINIAMRRKMDSRSREQDARTFQMATQLDLSTFLPYLLNRAGVQTGLNFSAALKTFRLSLQDWRVLIALWRSEEQRLLDVAEITGVDRSTLSRQIAALAKAGLVARKKSASDGRALCIALTAKGRNLTARIIPIARAHEAAATKGLSAEQLETLTHCLKLIYENLKGFEHGDV
jgi:DNA-binding MarR family transcriptional regulator